MLEKSTAPAERISKQFMGNALNVMAGNAETEAVQSAFETFEPSERKSEIFAIGGGKGGIGKSLVSSGLSITLANRGRRVLLFDADLGGANLHTLLGIAPPARSITDFVERRVSSLKEVAAPTGVPNLSLISGAGDGLESANPKYAQKVRLLRKLRTAGSDNIVIDVGAGTGFNALDFFNLATVGILVALPEPTSIENGYRFLRGAALRRLRQVSTHDAFQKLLDEAHDAQGDPKLRHMHVIAQRAADIEPRLGESVLNALEHFSPRLVLNQVRDANDLKVGHGLRSVAHKMLGIDLRFQGAIPYDDTVWQAVRKRSPHVVAFPESKAAEALNRLVDNLHSKAQLAMTF
jgi:flagellar biosynthesis protein FlhG